MTQDDLFLHEQVMLLLLHDEKGTLHSGMIGHALGGAIVAELVWLGRLRVAEVRRSKLLETADRTQTGDPVLDECLERISAAKRRAAASTWVVRFGAVRGLRRRIAERLCQKGVLRKREDQVLWVFTRATYPTVNPDPERGLVDAVRASVAAEGDVDTRVAIVVGLAHSTGILRHVLDRKLIRERGDRIEAIARLDAAAVATREAVQAAQAAVAIATMSMTMIATGR